MIILTRLNGPEFALNPDLLERAESTPDTILTLVDGTKLLIEESVPEVVERIRQYRASILVAVQYQDDQRYAYANTHLDHEQMLEDKAEVEAENVDAAVVPLHRKGR